MNSPSTDSTIQQSAYIYNLFPRLLGTIPNWVKHFPEVAKMKFNWIFLNPFQYPGFSGSLYSIKDYYRLNPVFYDSTSGQSETEQIKWMLDQAHDHGLKVMMDLVVNHTAIDHPFIKEHKNWYKLDKDTGEIKNPGAWDNGKWISWGDLAEIDNECSADKDNLWNYWLDMLAHYLNMGFDGFRCDAAYKLPDDFWRFLIGKSKKQFPKTVWFAESLGCPIEDTIQLGKSGFEYTFNSSKWWDYEANWCLDQYEKNRPYSKTISFPESHDTERCFKEYKENPLIVEQKYLFSALFSAGIMMPIGFEYGFINKMHVVKTSTDDFEPIRHNFSDFIKNVNILKSSYQIFNEESKLDKITVAEELNIVVLLKTSLNYQERVLIIINQDLQEAGYIAAKDYMLLLAWDNKNEDLSMMKSHEQIETEDEMVLQPGEIKIFYSKIDS